MEASDYENATLKLINGAMVAVSLLALLPLGVLALYSFGAILNFLSEPDQELLGGPFFVIWSFAAVGVAISNLIFALNNFRVPSWKPILFIAGSSILITVTCPFFYSI